MKLRNERGSRRHITDRTDQALNRLHNVVDPPLPGAALRRAQTPERLVDKPLGVAHRIQRLLIARGVAAKDVSVGRLDQKLRRSLLIKPLVYATAPSRRMKW